MINFDGWGVDVIDSVQTAMESPVAPSRILPHDYTMDPGGYKVITRATSHGMALTTVMSTTGTHIREFCSEFLAFNDGDHDLLIVRKDHVISIEAIPAPSILPVD